MPEFSPHARGYKAIKASDATDKFVFPARAGLQINAVSPLLIDQTTSTQFYGAHTSQARASFPDRSLLGSLLSGWYPPPGLK